MTLAAGARLGPDEIQSPLGAGGMGEVYKARDARLDRLDPALKQRFEREAKTLARRFETELRYCRWCFDGD